MRIDEQTNHDSMIEELARKNRELECFFAISSAIEKRGAGFDDIIQDIAGAIPRAFTYRTGVRIILDGRPYVSEDFLATPWTLMLELSALCRPIGTLEVHADEHRTFHPDEHQLLKVIAGRISRVYARRLAEEQLSESENRYRSLFENSHDAIYTTARDGTIIDANQAMVDLMGYARGEIIGMDIIRLYERPQDRETFQRTIESCGAVHDYEVRLVRKDGTPMDCLYTSSVWKHEDGSIIGYQGIIRDITEKRRMAAERDRLIAELQDALDNIHTLKELIPGSNADQESAPTGPAKADSRSPSAGTRKRSITKTSAPRSRKSSAKVKS
ncbi:MAG: PAS domain-containing protein [Syntrophaceae bacterium]